MALTPHSQLQQWLVVLGHIGGSASRAEALGHIEQRFASAFAATDLEPVPSRPWETKWRNRVSWQRDRMVKSGLLGPNTGAGTPWTLTDAGWALCRDALNVALAIIQQRAVLIESAGSAVRLPSIVMNMNYVFEAYVRNVLMIHATTNAWSESVLDGNQAAGRKLLFNEKPSMDATPDIVVKAPNESIALVLEVKNVPIKESFSERSHINQAVTYGVSYRARRVVLVHPRKSACQDPGMRLQGMIDEIEVYQFCFDLAADDLEAEETAFGTAVAALISGGPA